MSRRPLLARVAAVLFALAAAAPGAARATTAPSIYDNFHSFPVGSRAAGMGGAYTALACDEGALHYNPGALACSGSSRLELSANAYVLHGFSVPDAFGRGEDISALTYHSLPSIVGGVRILLDGDEPQPGEDARPGRLAFGLSVSVPHSIALEADPADPTRPSYLAASVRDAITAADIGLGWQVNRWLGVGLAVGAVLRTSHFLSSGLVVASDPSPCGAASAPTEECTSFVSLLDETESIAVGARAKLGLRVAPTRAWSLGLSVASPTLDVYSNVDVARTTGFALAVDDPATGVIFGYGPVPLRLTGRSELGMPFRIALGAAYSTGRFTASLDASINLPREVTVARDLTAEAIQGAPPATPEDLADVTLTYAAQPNVNLGVEIGLTDSVLLDLGAFTDFSAVSAKDQEQGIDRIHMFGGSLALGLLGRRSRAWFGASFEYGQGESRVPSGRLTLEEVIQSGLAEDARSTATRWTLVGILGSSYSFVPGD